MIEYDARTLRAMFGRPLRPAIPITLAQVSIAAQKLAGRPARLQ